MGIAKFTGTDGQTVAVNTLYWVTARPTVDDSVIPNRRTGSVIQLSTGDSVTVKQQLPTVLRRLEAEVTLLDRDDDVVGDEDPND